MNQLEFDIQINAKAERVWFVLWNDFNYRKWTAAFNEGSFAISDWKEGSGVHFLSPDGKGMYSKIKTSIPEKQMTFEHIGYIADFIEQPLNEETEAWSGGVESYFLSEQGDVTNLKVAVDVIEEYESYFKDKFPLALELVRIIAENPTIKVEAIADAEIEKVWACWTLPEHIVNWNFASPDWHCPKAENDLRAGGHFSYIMASRDGAISFDFNGDYNEVHENQRIIYHIEDGRKVEIYFDSQGDKTKIVEIFEAESMNPLELQEMGWQAILNNFANYVQSN